MGGHPTCIIAYHSERVAMLHLLSRLVEARSSRRGAFSGGGHFGLSRTDLKGRSGWIKVFSSLVFIIALCLFFFSCFYFKLSFFPVLCNITLFNSGVPFTIFFPFKVFIPFVLVHLRAVRKKKLSVLVICSWKRGQDKHWLRLFKIS